MESIYEICFYGGLVLAILLLITAAILFVAFKIPRVFGELTGRSAKKSIKEMKENSDGNSSATKRGKSKNHNNAVNVKDLPKPLIETAATEISQEKEIDTDEKTDVLASKKGDTLDFSVSNERNRASGKSASNGDEVLTDVLKSTSDGELTDILTSQDEESTAVLTRNMANELGRKVKVTYNIVITHTAESL